MWKILEIRIITHNAMMKFYLVVLLFSLFYAVTVSHFLICFSCAIGILSAFSTIVKLQFTLNMILFSFQVCAFFNRTKCCKKNCNKWSTSVSTVASFFVTN